MPWFPKISGTTFSPHSTNTVALWITPVSAYPQTETFGRVYGGGYVSGFAVNKSGVSWPLRVGHHWTHFGNDSFRRKCLWRIPGMGVNTHRSSGFPEKIWFCDSIGESTWLSFTRRESTASFLLKLFSTSLSSLFRSLHLRLFYVSFLPGAGIQLLMLFQFLLMISGKRRCISRFPSGTISNNLFFLS